MKESPKSDERPNGWWPNCSDGFSDIEYGVAQNETRNGLPTTFLKSARFNFKNMDCPKLTRSCSPKDYHGSRVKLTGWVKTELTDGAANLWIRVDGDWPNMPARAVHFDNMWGRPITGKTDWTNYSLVVEVPPTSTLIVYGLFLQGLGELWLGDVTIEKVTQEAALTGHDWD